MVQTAETAEGAATFIVPEWTPADTEESVVGTQWHQQASGALSDILEEVARRHGASWGVCEQIALLDTGGRYPDGHVYNPRPDVMVLAQPLPWGGMSTIRLGDAGVPLFIAEVASKSTVGNDVGTKRELFEFIGVPEYIVFDAVGNVLSTPLLAWRLGSDGYVPWLPEADGSWRSASLGITIEPTRPILSIRDREGHHVAWSREAPRRTEWLEQQLAETQERLTAVERAREEDARQRAELKEQIRRLRSPDNAQTFDHGTEG